MAASQAAAVEVADRPGDEGALAADHSPRSLGRHVMQDVDGRMLGWARPELPDIDGITGKTVREMVPVVAPGRAMVIPTGFSNFNEKFSYIRYLNSLDFVGDDENVFARGQGTLFPSFIIVESGVFDLPTLKSRIEQGGGPGDFLTSDGRVYQLNVPLLIGSDATLVITAADVEELRLNTSSNAYIVNSGRLFLVGSTLTSWDPGPGAPTPRSKDDWLDFNAFYVGWSGSETYVADAHVNGLGYGNGKSYGFVLSSGPENVLRATSNAVEKPTGIVVNSLFTDMYYGFYTYDAENVSVVGNAYSDNTVYAIDPHDWSENLTFAYNTTLDTHTKHGIVTSREVRRSYIVGNITSGNAGSGILLDRTSNDNVVAYNLSIGNKGDGLTLYESSCNLVYRNTFSGNARAGVRIRNSADVLLSENEINDNAESGLSAYVSRLEDDPRQATRDLVMDPYHAYTDFTAAHNVITGNERGAVDAELGVGDGSRRQPAEWATPRRSSRASRSATPGRWRCRSRASASASAMRAGRPGRRRGARSATRAISAMMWSARSTLPCAPTSPVACRGQRTRATMRPACRSQGRANERCARRSRAIADRGSAAFVGARRAPPRGGGAARGKGPEGRHRFPRRRQVVLGPHCDPRRAPHDRPLPARPGQCGADRGAREHRALAAGAGGVRRFTLLQISDLHVELTRARCGG